MRTNRHDEAVSSFRLNNDSSAKYVHTARNRKSVTVSLRKSSYMDAPVLEILSSVLPDIREISSPKKKRERER